MLWARLRAVNELGGGRLPRQQGGVNFFHRKRFPLPRSLSSFASAEACTVRHSPGLDPATLDHSWANIVFNKAYNTPSESLQKCEAVAPIPLVFIFCFYSRVGGL